MILVGRCQLLNSVDEFWNTIPTAKILLVKGNQVSTSSDGISASALASLAGDNNILIGCNDDVSGFDSGGIGAVGTIASSGNTARGAVIINDHANS